MKKINQQPNTRLGIKKLIILPSTNIYEYEFITIFKTETLARDFPAQPNNFLLGVTKGNSCKT